MHHTKCKYYNYYAFIIDIGINNLDNFSFLTNLLVKYTTIIEIIVIKLLILPNDNSVETTKKVIIVINVDNTPNELSPLKIVLSSSISSFSYFHLC